MILVVGATGVLGGMVTRQLLAQEKAVRILVRRCSIRGTGQTGYGDLCAILDRSRCSAHGWRPERPAFLNRACAGVATVITTANSILRGGEDNIVTVDLNGTKNLIDAAKAADVSHFIYVSVLGSAPDHPHPFCQRQGPARVYLKQSGLTYTILKPGMFMEVWIGDVRRRAAARAACHPGSAWCMPASVRLYYRCRRVCGDCR